MGKKQRSKQRRAVTRNAQKGEETDSSVTDNNYAVENKDSRELGKLISNWCFVIYFIYGLFSLLVLFVP